MYAAAILLPFLIRVTLGLFFFLARFRWLYDPSRPDQPWLNTARHKHFAERLCTCGYGMHPVLDDFVACVEILGGLGLVFGFLTQLSGLGLACVLTVATFCTAKDKVMAQGPVDWIDCVSDYLWRVEFMYLLLALYFAVYGAGPLSLDHLLGVPQI